MMYASKYIQVAYYIGPMQDMPLHAQLWKRYQEGEKGAFGLLYKRYHKHLSIFCLGILKEMSLAEDIASETLNKLLHYPDPAGIRNAEQWLFAVARNACYSHLQQSQRRKQIEMEIAVNVERTRPSTGEGSLFREDINNVIGQALEEKERTVWEWHQLGYENGEIARKTGLSIKTVANCKAIARKN